jgi:hypothetical protein
MATKPSFARLQPTATKDTYEHTKTKGDNPVKETD